MFIQYGDRRINLDLVKQYRPKEKGENYKIEFIYQNGEIEEIYFFQDKDKRDEFLKTLDEKNLKK
ncbi:MAG: hypothetical protein PHF86_01615 [Candidatus Nanoarchaeia archaeon]|nr:hypothetical protein [Candidatus Nanoarchaeia archaeon]